MIQIPQVIQMSQGEGDPDLQATMHNIAGQLAPTSRKTHSYDAKHFAFLMADHDLTLHSLSRNNHVTYRAHLAEMYAKATASRMWEVAQHPLDEAVQCQVLAKNPAEGIRGFRSGDDESPHRALKREEAGALLDGINQRMALGKRDYTLIMLLLRTGICRSEAAMLTLGDLAMKQGYHVVIIRHSKSNKRGLTKLPVEVHQAIDDYLEATGRT